MKRVAFFSIFITILFSSSLFAENQLLEESGFLSNLPPGETVEAPPEELTEDPPIYLDVDDKGKIYSHYLELDKAGNYVSKTARISKKKIAEIRSQGRNIILQNMAETSLPGETSGEMIAAASTSSCPLPTRFSITGSSNGAIPIGFAKVVNTSRPVGATTQWIVFDFWTRRYRGRGSHMPIHLFHDEILHGWGSFIGDNHGSYRWDSSYAGCGASSRHNSQIQAWTQYPDAPPPAPDETTKFWQSYAFNGSNSCGSEMYDEPVWILPGYYYVPRYRMEMQTSTGRWVAYRIFEYIKSLGDWVVLTDWKVLDVDANPSAWEHTPLQWLSEDAEGIFIQATPTTVGNNYPWSINISNTQCGWF